MYLKKPGSAGRVCQRAPWQGVRDMSESSALASELDSSSKITQFIEEKLNDIELPNDKRNILSSSCFHIVLENHKAVQLLIADEFYGSSATLLRPMFEACVRGNWFLHCAVDTQIERFISKDDVKKKLGEQISQLEKLPVFSNGWLSSNYQTAYQTMHSLTHPGMQQVNKRFDGSNVALKFQESEIIEILEASNNIALFTSLSMAIAIDSEVLAKEIGDFSSEYHSKNL